MAVWNSQANAIFLKAIEIASPQERIAYLDEVCGGDASLREEVDELLAADEQAGDYLEQPAVQQAVEAVEQGRCGETEAEPGPDNQDGDGLPFLDPPRVPGSLGRISYFEVLNVVGRGGMGIVLRALDTNLQKVVAIKVLAPELAASRSARQRFMREARAAAAVKHGNVIAINRVEDTGRIVYLVMEFIDGQTLQAKLEQTGPLPLKEVLRIGMQVASGLAAAHAQGIVHRDIKPANILLENGVQRVTITDFGLARAVHDPAPLTKNGTVVGTPQYMSPEQAHGEQLDHRTDIFS